MRFKKGDIVIRIDPCFVYVFEVLYRDGDRHHVVTILYENYYEGMESDLPVPRTDGVNEINNTHGCIDIICKDKDWKLLLSALLL